MQVRNTPPLKELGEMKGQFHLLEAGSRCAVLIIEKKGECLIRFFRDESHGGIRTIRHVPSRKFDDLFRLRTEVKRPREQGRLILFPAAQPCA